MRVVVVDGHPVMRLGLRTVLDTQEDIRVVGESGSGGEALRLVAEGGPDLVVLDLNLIEEPDGVEVCRRTKALPEPLPPDLHSAQPRRGCILFGAAHGGQLPLQAP